MATGDVYRALWRHKVFIAALTICVVAATWFLTSGEQKVYQASTLVRVEQTVPNPQDVYGALQTGGLLAQTYANIVDTTTVAQLIARDLSGQVPSDQIVGSISSHQIQNLDLLSIAAESTVPANAALIANAAPAALRDFIKRTATQGDQIITVQPAGIPTSPVAPNLKLNVAIALLVGLLFNGGLALLFDIFADRVVDTEEFEQIARVPLLGLVPNLTFAPADFVNTSADVTGVQSLELRRATHG